MKYQNYRTPILVIIAGFPLTSAQAQNAPDKTAVPVAQETNRVKALKKEIAEAEKTKQEKERELYDVAIERRQAWAEADNELEDKDGHFQWSYQLVKPATRVYFDSGSDGENEIDLFKDGNLGVSLEFGCIHCDYLWRGIEVGPFVAAGISSASSATSDSVVLIWTAGLAFEMKDLPFGVELGFMQGISADESKKGQDRDDSAFYVGINLNKLMEKTDINLTKH